MAKKLFDKKLYQQKYYRKHKEHLLRYSKKRKKKYFKTITKYPENGITLDVVDMMERNTERFNYGLELNR